MPMAPAVAETNDVGATSGAAPPKGKNPSVPDLINLSLTGMRISPL